MSYILDALRRADSERDRGAVPDVHARQVPLAAGDAERAPAALPVWAWVLAALAVLLIGALAWMLLAREPARESAREPARESAREAVATVPAIAAGPVAGSAPAMAAVPAPPLSSPQLPPQLPALLPPGPLQAPPTSRATATPVVKAPVRPQADAAVANANAATEPKAKASAAEPRTYAVAELPDEVRRELPALAIGGAMYSENPANRLLIINGQTFHERDKLAPGLVLVQIKLKSAVLEFKGYRYGISY